MSDVVIKVERVSKLYRLGEIGTGTISHDLNRWWASLRGKEDPFSQVGGVNDRTQNAVNNNEQVWALKDINFEVKQGEVLGIIGRNGAGKSTLLKLLSRITAPTKGEIKIKGRIASLLEVGTGMHPEMTGIENIYLSGTILGMTRREITRKLEEILDFAGCLKYADTPVKRYSSGMKVRLGFAVAAFLEPEILIVDEVLAVGDAEFQKKAIGRMKDVSAGEGRTVLFVSHNLSAIANLCTRGLILNSGQLIKDDVIDQCIAAYSNLSLNALATDWVNQDDFKSGPLVFKKISVKVIGAQPDLELNAEIELQSLSQHEKAFLSINILDGLGVSIMQAIPNSIPFIEFGESKYNVIVNLPPLIPGTYYLSFWCGSHNTQTFDYRENILSFEVIGSPLAGRSFPHHSAHGYIIPPSVIK